MEERIEMTSFQNFNLHLKNSQLNKPVVFHGLISSWPAQRWTPTNLVNVFEDIKLMFRVGQKDCVEVQYEPGCEYVSASILEFNQWSTGGSCSANNPLSKYKIDSHWCYADYKHMSELFTVGTHRDTVMHSVDWSSLGFTERSGEQSTFWMGTEGAYTVCHYDTYGCNLVAQIHGRKRWMLYPPNQTNYLYPTRIPYEESSVFSQVNIKSPDWSRHPLFKEATPYVVVLEAGDLLFVPHLWWHFVENLETSISINTWIELGGVDDHERIKESVTRVLTQMIIAQDDSCDLKEWLNPTEELSSHSENLNLVHSAVVALRMKTAETKDNSNKSLNHLKRNIEGSRIQNKMQLDESPPPTKKVYLKESAHQTTRSSKEVGDAEQRSGTALVVPPTSISEGSVLLPGSACSCGSLQCNTCRRPLENTNNSVAGCDEHLRITTDSKVFVSAEFETKHVTRIHPRCTQTSTIKEPIDKIHSEEGASGVVSRDSFTSVDLAAVLLHPDVIDVIYSKLVDRFQLHSD